MKNLFPEYENSRAINYKDVWNDALFVFDTNVLLNLYRYRVNTRGELLDVLDEISDRIWIPYQVALEFQRNRLGVIAEQIKRFSEVRRTVEKVQAGLKADLAKLKLQERHSLINAEPLVVGFDKLISEFFAELTVLEKDQQTISGEDQLKDKLEALFDGRVGTPVSNQAELDQLYKEGESRYKFKIPPGFEDNSKDSKDPDEFMHGGMIYKRKYGDFVIWKQMIKYCKDNGKTSLIFITDDAKEDWWRVLDADGPKNIGPRAELIDEARRSGEVENFLMYTPSRFLVHAKSSLKARVSEDAIQEVKDISFTRRFVRQRLMIETTVRGVAALKAWLADRSESVLEGPVNSSVTALQNGEQYTYLIAVAKQTKSAVDLYDRTERMMAGAVFSSPDGIELGHIVVVWLAENPNHAANIRATLLFNKSVNKGRSLGVDVIVATLDDPETLQQGFFVQWEFPL